jgi:hypothetical protein
LAFYDYGEHGGQFVGYRVAVSVNGKLRQKYYSLNHYTKEKAYELAKAKEDELLGKQTYYFRNRVLTRATSTGIVGLYFRFDHKSRCQKLQRLVRYAHMKDGKLLFKSWGMTQHDLTEDEWFEICRFIKNTRGLNNNTFEKILNKYPSPEKVNEIYDDMAKKLNIEKRDGAYYLPIYKDAA